ncbi:hypothetical protein DET56_12621 [Paenibacillus pabuli]|uniref:Uncharacterized protein n=1 Tax=Paenibacillus pabuli TaxID=1472 RepID=A0A855XXD7_9BACL|nr:hypothetical protein DET56_12621 [Paenibacillus pabuli]PXV98016.1 hypothetical protein DEU73_12420 [Paenibacillus taichungensis]
MHAIRAQLSMYPKWFVAVLMIFTINLILTMTMFINLTLILANLAMLYVAFSIRTFKYNKFHFALCLVLSITFVIIAFKTYPI